MGERERAKEPTPWLDWDAIACVAPEGPSGGR